MRVRMIKMKDVLGFESSWTYWTLFFLCALVPLPARADITCTSCFAPIRRNEAQVKATAFVSRDFGSVLDGSADKNWKWGIDGAQLSLEAHIKSPSVSWREKPESAHISQEERASPAEKKDGKVNPTWSPEETKVNRRDKRSLFSSDSTASSRFEFRRTGGVDGTGKSPRQNEPHLITSTFALSGDSAHNQAMVLWSGHNSSVILILTKLFDFNLGTVTESSLWRSVDFGTTYEKLTDKVMIRTMLSYLYVCPTNKRKILILSDPEVESSLLISSDEGATFQKFNINFYIMSLLFHPTQENWILAYSHDQRLYSSVDFGKKWILVHERVTPGRFYWALSGLDKEAELVHIEARTDSGQMQYITCRAQKCSEEGRQYPFSGRIDTNSLVVQDQYIFLQLTTAGRTTYFVSYQRGPFRTIQLPKYCLPKDMHIVSTDEGQVLAAVQEWNENDTYSLYISDTPGVYFTRSLPNLRTSRGLAGNLIVDVYKVSGVSGLIIANKKEDMQMRTYITYNKGQTWRLLQPPAKDTTGHDINCNLPSCSLHLHLQMSENPYTPDTISTKHSAPGIIVATGNIGPELSFSNTGMFISSDAGNTWRQIFEEEHSVWFLDHGGALLAVTQSAVPTRHLWISLDEGRQWDKLSFSSTPLFVDGVLMTPETENRIITFFGHFSYHSDWQLIKIDYSSLFGRKCTDGDFQTWHLHNKGEMCVMGEKQMYMKRKPGTRCTLGREYSRVVSAESCICTLYDFECDYGFERQASGKCAPAFWYDVNLPAHTCSHGQRFRNSTGYRRVLLNNCREGLKDTLSPRMQQCKPIAPSGLQLSTINSQLTAVVGTNITFRVALQNGDSLSTSLHVDFGDGISVSYSNISRLGDSITHTYRVAGIFRVTAHAQNSQGTDSSSVYLHITSPVERIFLSAPVVVTRGREANLTAVLWPSQPRTATFYWWFNNSTEPLITLEGSVSHTFTREGLNSVTVQVSAGGTVLQDVKIIAVRDFFRSLLLSFSPNLEEHNPSVAEWRQDVGRVVRATLSQVCGFPENQLLVSVFPGTPTAAELFILPETNQSAFRSHTEEQLDKMSEVFMNALNQNLIQFDLKPDTRVTVSVSQLTLAPLVDSSVLPSGSAMLLLISLGLVGLAILFIYKFKRKIPWIHVETEDTHEKEPEMISAVGQEKNGTHTTATSFTSCSTHTTHTSFPSNTGTHNSFSHLPPPRELMEKELEAQNPGGLGVGERLRTRQIPNCTNV
ncbi:LOW QUALITY PROTEIN: VPS10 domain-containing receptor SorCS3 [Megalobrama amblycephala]|uniref:LOW QUALITY PROTEIN: VPS10 domain-containing receptor SorCS3 n=1 Tax=Megalobrama amblycephala TaxID=75352 RepID=UPI0020141FC0|nr:LOW QUALITY PROTEIN: VPS10 domain-containing receptor SorCS3 [Megalobrama amblycephala]